MPLTKTARFPGRVEKRRKVALAQREKDLNRAELTDKSRERITGEIASLKKSLRIS